MRKLFALALAAAMLLCSGALAETTTVKGFGGEITIDATIENGSVTALTITGANETPAIGGAAIPVLQEAILAAGTSEGVDCVAGATVTSTAVLSGVAQLMDEAAGVENAPSSLVPGTYTGEAKGYSGIVTAAVTVSENAITDVVIDQHDNPDSVVNAEHPNYVMMAVCCRENDSIFLTVKENLPERIIAAQSTSVDAIAGATASSNAALMAVRNALTAAGASASDFASIPEKSSAKEVYDADIVVVGAGTSGVTAAAQATELGAKVVLVEKSAKLGGTGSLSAGPMAMNSTKQVEMGHAEDFNNLYEDYDVLMHWDIKGNLFRKVLENSGETADWMIEHGFVDMVPDTSWFAETHGGPGRLMAYGTLPYLGNSVTAYFDTMASTVDTVLRETTATEILVDEKGNAVGVKAIRYDGTEITVNAKAVIVATGSFAGSEELQQEKLGACYKVLGLKQNTGDGLRMMTAIGAQEYNDSLVCSHAIGVPAEPQGFEAFDRAITYNLVTSAALLQVNSKGERFMNEEIQDTDMTRGSVMHAAQGSYTYSILSQSQVEKIAKAGVQAVGQNYDSTVFSFECVSFPRDTAMPNIQAVLDAACEQGLAVKGDTVEKLAAQIGADPEILATTLAEYDAMCEAGEDTAYRKQVSPANVIGEGPYYGVKATTVIYNAIGAVEVDSHCQVMDVNGGLIGGLYAVGADAQGNIMDGKAYTNVSGINLAWAFGSGRLAAQCAVEAISE